MKQNKTGPINKWKLLCLFLLSVGAGLLLVLGGRVLTPREHFSLPVLSQEGDTKVGTFTTNREQLNATISRYLERYQKPDATYRLYATNQLVVFEGQYSILGTTIPLYLYLYPSRLEDGSLLLSVSEISAGTLSFPKVEVLTYLQKQYDLPEFVHIDAKKSEVVIQLPAIANSLGIYGKVNTIELYHDQILLDLYQKQ